MKDNKAELAKAIKELHHWWHSYMDHSFTAELFNLIHTADSVNRTKLAIGFPEEVLAWTMWQQAPDEQKFWKENGLWEGKC